MPTAKAQFTLKTWDEKPYLELDDGAKMTKSTITYGYSGDIEGENQLEYLMYYNPDKSGTVVGLQRVTGSFAGKKGSFAIKHVGTFDTDGKSGVQESLEIVPGSGTDELVGLRGTGTFDISGHMEAYPVEFTYSFDGD